VPGALTTATEYPDRRAPTRYPKRGEDATGRCASRAPDPEEATAGRALAQAPGDDR
jgi:hypothetical protein